MNDFELRELLRAGVFDAVYSAYDRSRGLDVALKTPLRGQGNNKQIDEWFITQGPKLARLAHPGILRVAAVGLDTDILYALCLFPKNWTFLDQLLRGPAGAFGAAQLTFHLAGALQYAYETHELVHGDIHPGNIVLETADETCEELGCLLLGACFTEARITRRPRALMSPIRATPYMSPEQRSLTSYRLDIRSDIYSLGQLLFRLVVGRVPSGAEPVRPPDSPDVLPNELRAIIEKATAYEPDERYQEMQNFRSDIQVFLGRGREEALPS
jgi:serine/threonine protein kinase